MTPTNTNTMAYFPCSATQGSACSDDHAIGMDRNHHRINAMQFVDGMAGQTRTHDSSHLRPQHLSPRPNHYINLEEENSDTKPVNNSNGNTEKEKNKDNNNNKNRKKCCEKKKNKQPQRGLGVAQLEKLRLQERWNRMADIPPPAAAAAGFQHNDLHHFIRSDDHILSVDQFGSSLPWIGGGGGGSSVTGYCSTTLPTPRDISKMLLTNTPIHPHCSRPAEYMAVEPFYCDGSRRNTTTSTTAAAASAGCCCTWAYRCCSTVAPLAGNNKNDVSKASARPLFPSELSSNQNQHLHYYCSYYHSTDHFHDFKMVGVNGEINNGSTAGDRCSYPGRENLNHLFSVGHNIGSTCHKTAANHDLPEMAEVVGCTSNMNTDTEEEVKGMMIKEYELFPCNDKIGYSGESSLGTSTVSTPSVPKSENTTSTPIDLTLRLS